MVAALALQAGWGGASWRSPPASPPASRVYAFNGLVVGGLGLDPLIVTLAAWIWARGLAVSLTNARRFPSIRRFVGFMNTPIVFGFTPAVVLVAGSFLVGWLVLTRLPIGMRIYALGNDARMLRQSASTNARCASHASHYGRLHRGRHDRHARPLRRGGPDSRLRPRTRRHRRRRDRRRVVSRRRGTARDTAIGVLFLAVLNNGLSGLQMGDAQFFLIKGGAILAALTLRAAARLLPAARRPRMTMAARRSSAAETHMPDGEDR